MTVEGSEDPSLLLGLDAPDDAAVYRVGLDLAIVQSVDFFTPIVDDPYDWGAIAAANAISDIYAMGARPVAALNLVSWPRDEIGFDVLGRVLKGGAEKAAEAGVSIMGGHSIDDAEPKFGMAVTGLVHPDELIKTSGARPGSVVVLTKPIGTGIISTAIKNAAAEEAEALAAIESMKTLNSFAAGQMRAARAWAATDVTGFGLLGHLHDMCALSEVGAEIDLRSVPVLEGTRRLVEKGLVPGGTRRNQAHFAEFVDFSPSVETPDRTILFDAQTSGGLLVSVEESRAEEISGWIIGRFIEGDRILVT